MTKQINSKETISGISIMQIRDLFRHVASWQQESFGLSWLKERLSIDEDTASVLAQELVAQGYIARAQKHEYRFTDKGYDFVRASAAGKVTLKTAKDALVALLDRVDNTTAIRTRSWPSKLSLYLEAFSGRVTTLAT